MTNESMTKAFAQAAPCFPTRGGVRNVCETRTRPACAKDVKSLC